METLMLLQAEAALANEWMGPMARLSAEHIFLARCYFGSR